MLRVLLLSMVVGAAYGRDPGNIVVTATPVTAGGAATVVVYGNSTSRRLTVVHCLRLFCVPHPTRGTAPYARLLYPTRAC